MARQWWLQMWGIWFTLYLPIAIVSMAVFPNKFYAVLLLWWLKPLFDRAMLYALSRLVFSEQSGVRETLRAARDWMRPGLFLALTLRRFELARSFTLPVAALEKQTGKSAAACVVLESGLPSFASISNSSQWARCSRWATC